MKNLFSRADRIFEDYIEAINLLLPKKLNTQALALLFSLVDTISFLSMSPNKSYNTREDFLSWVELYWIPYLENRVTALDLYAARCSILHSSTAESKLISKGDASPIFYTLGNMHPQELQEVTDLITDEFPYPKSPVALSINRMVSGLVSGWDTYKKWLVSNQSENKEQIDMIFQRSGMLFRNSLYK